VPLLSLQQDALEAVEEALGAGVSGLQDVTADLAGAATGACLRGAALLIAAVPAGWMG
jgi:hypothetical protein